MNEVEDHLPSLRSTEGAEPFGYFDQLRSHEPVHWDSGGQRDERLGGH
jgi:hypothetical protein